MVSIETAHITTGPSERFPERRPPWTAAALLACVALALGLRLAANGFGLPDTFEPDEPKLVNHALAFGTGDLNPHYFVYPALQMYLLFFCYGLLYVVLRAAGSVESLEGFKLLFLSDPTVFYRVGRGLTALSGAASVFLLFLLGRRLYGQAAVGLLAAAALALHPVDVRHGHYVTADVPMTTLLLLALVFLAPTLERPSPAAGFRAGAAAGLATAVKYSGLAFLAPLAAAHALAARRAPGPAVRRSLLVALAGLALAFALASPFSVLEWRKTLDGMRFILDVKRDGQFGIARGSSWGTYFQLAFLAGPLALLSLAGLLNALVRRTPADLLLLAFLVPYFLAVGGSQSHSPRYLVPAFPLLLLLAARWLVGLRLGARGRATVAAAALLFALGQSLGVVRDLLRPDTRQLARRWIEGHVPAGESIALEWGGDDTVRLAETAESIEAKIRRHEQGGTTGHSREQIVAALRLKQKAQGNRPAYRLVQIGENRGNRLEGDGQDLDALRRTGVGYLVTSSAALGDPRSAAFRRAYPDIAGFYDRLEREAELVRRFDPEAGASRGPTITLWRLRAQGEGG